MSDMRIEDAIAEIERLLSENDKLCKSVIFWRDKAVEIERLTRDLEIWKRNGGDTLQRAEIERLKAENADLRRWKALDKPLTAAMAIVVTDMQQLRADNERLRAALQPFAKMYAAPGGDLDKAIAIVRAELEPKP